jgi:hypothetical protein
MMALEMRYVVNGSAIVVRRFENGADLVRESMEIRFDLEARGWEPVESNRDRCSDG